MSEDPVPKGQIWQNFRPSDLGTALSLLTRIPLYSNWVNPDRLAASAWAFPLVGGIVGAMGGVLLVTSEAIGMSPALAALLSLGLMVLITGGLHEDGLADTADGLGGGASKERALEIMKDSRIGAYGTIILILFFGARWSAMIEVSLVAPILALIWVGTISRLPMVLLMTFMSNAREGGLSHHVGRPDWAHVGAAIVLSAIVTVSILGLWGIVGVLVVGLACFPIIAVAYKKLKGQTGDILGGVQQCAEVAALIFLAVIWS